MHPDLTIAVRLQELDAHAAELIKEIAALPRHIAEIEKKLESHQRRLDADRAAMIANQRERKRLEAEILTQDQKKSKLRDQMAGAKTNDQYRAFQHEIDFCEQEVRKFEDRILDLMGESEALDKNVQTAEAALKIERQQVDAENAEAKERTIRFQNELNSSAGERAALAASMTPAVLTNYERIRKGRGGFAVAEILLGRCSRCQIVLRPQLSQEIRRGEKIFVCESCGRMLYYNPPRSFDDLVPQSVR